MKSKWWTTLIIATFFSIGMQFGMRTALVIFGYVFGGVALGAAILLLGVRILSWLRGFWRNALGENERIGLVYLLVIVAIVSTVWAVYGVIAGLLALIALTLMGLRRDLQRGKSE